MTETVSASVLAQHLDCSRTYIGKLEAEGVIQRQGDDAAAFLAVFDVMIEEARRLRLQ